MDKKQIIAEIHAKIKSAEKILIPVSGRLDADGVGSALAFHLFLNSQGKSVTVIYDSPLVYPFTEFPGAEAVRLVDMSSFDASGFDLALVTDTSAPQNLASDYHPDKTVSFLQNLFVINIDHHQNSMFGQINLVDPASSAACALVLDVLEPLGITPDIATLLFTGLVTDSLFFRTHETSPDTFLQAARLLSLGADKYKARFWTESFPKEVLPVIKDLLSRIEIVSHPVPYALLVCPFDLISFYQKEVYERAHTIIKETLMWGIRETKFTVTLNELQPNFVKGSLRGNKKPIDLRLVASEFGGGGHAHAAGFIINASLDQACAMVEKAILAHYPQIFTQGI